MGRAQLGDASAPHCTEQSLGGVHLVAGLETLGQLHSHAWCLGGESWPGELGQGHLPLHRSQSLFAWSLQQGTQTSSKAAQEAGRSQRSQRQEVEAASLLRHNVMSITFD